jgi:pyridoxine 5-phosphate synthase
MVFNIKPTQVTLVPDAIDALTSNAGWNTVKHRSYLTEIISEFKNHGIRTSIFVDPKMEMIEGAAATGTDRIELYTEDFAAQYNLGNKKAVEPYTQCALKATELGLGINAGHDLSLENIRFFKDNIPNLLEVSIGHALICESIYLGLENVIGQYLKKLK